MIWAVLALLAVVALAPLIVTLVRYSAARGRQDSAIALHRAQLAELDRDLADGRIARDAPGQVAIDFGVYGVPETYLVDKDGIVRWRWAGPLTPEIVTQELQPLLKKYA